MCATIHNISIILVFCNVACHKRALCGRAHLKWTNCALWSDAITRIPLNLYITQTKYYLHTFINMYVCMCVWYMHNAGPLDYVCDICRFCCYGKSASWCNCNIVVVVVVFVARCICSIKLDQQSNLVQCRTPTQATLIIFPARALLRPSFALRAHTHTHTQALG